MGEHSRRDLLRTGGAALAGAFGLPSLAAAVQAASSPYRRPKLKITDIRTAEVRVHGHQTHVRVYTDQGIFGQGECTDAAVGSAAIIQRVFRRFLINQDPLNIDFLFERLRTMGIFGGAQAGQYVTALTGVEIALWDLAGKALGLPVYQLLGGKMRDRIRIYCDSAHHHKEDPKTSESLQWVKDQGFTIVKMDCDNAMNPYRWDRVNWTANNQEIDMMVEEVRFVRESFPRSVQLCVDAHGRFDVPTGKRLAKEFEQFDLLFFEEPVPAEYVPAMRDIRESTSTPICCGENRYLRQGFVDILEQHAADVVMPDIQKCGGLLESRKIADLAHSYYIPVAPHCVVSPIGTMGSVHVCAAIPNFIALEWHWMPHFDLWKGWVKEGNILKNGFIDVTDTPGLGVTMNEEVARSRQVPGTPWFEEWKTD